MNSKIIYGKADDFFTWSGKRFSTLNELEQYAESAIARREKIAGRSLSPKELLIGLNHAEDRDTRQQVTDSAWKVTPPEDEATDAGNPYRAILDQKKREQRLAKMSPMEAMLSKRAAEFDADQEAEAARDEFESDPRRTKAVAHAEEVLEKVLFNSAAPMSEVVQAQQRLRQAKEGCLTTYKEMADEFAARQEAVTAQRLAELDEQRAALDAERATLTRFEDQDPQQPNVYYPESYDPQRIEEFGREYRDAWRKHRGDA